MRRLKAESMPRPSTVGFPSVAPPPKPERRGGEPDGKPKGKRPPVKTPPIKPPQGLRMEAVPMPKLMPKPAGSTKEAAPKPEPEGEPKSSKEATAVVLKPAVKKSIKKRLVHRPKKVTTKKEEVEETETTGEPGVAGEAPLPNTGAPGGSNTKAGGSTEDTGGVNEAPKEEVPEIEEPEFPDFDPPDDEDDGLETIWEEESEEEEVREQDRPVDPENPFQVTMVEREEDIVFGGEIWTCRYDVSLEDLMINTRRRALNETMRMVLPDELILKINYKPGAGYDDFYGWEYSDDVSGDLDVAYYMHREWRRQFFDSTRDELYFEVDDKWTWGTLTVEWFTDGYKFMSLQERCGRRMPYLKEDWRGYTCFFRKRRATFENPLTQQQWENL